MEDLSGQLLDGLSSAPLPRSDSRTYGIKVLRLLIRQATI